jgi:hypothetical protein
MAFGPPPGESIRSAIRVQTDSMMPFMGSGRLSYAGDAGPISMPPSKYCCSPAMS